jgi:hypothetical protein
LNIRELLKSVLAYTIGSGQIAACMRSNSTFLNHLLQPEQSTHVSLYHGSNSTPYFCSIIALKRESSPCFQPKNMALSCLSSSSLPYDIALGSPLRPTISTQTHLCFDLLNLFCHLSVSQEVVSIN